MNRSCSYTYFLISGCTCIRKSEVTGAIGVTIGLNQNGSCAGSDQIAGCEGDVVARLQSDVAACCINVGSYSDVNGRIDEDISAITGYSTTDQEVLTSLFVRDVTQKSTGSDSTKGNIARTGISIQNIWIILNVNIGRTCGSIGSKRN